MQRFISLLLVLAFMMITSVFDPPAHALRYEGEEGEKTTKSMKPLRPARDTQKGSKATPAQTKESDKAPRQRQDIRIKIYPKVDREGQKE